jgi:O-succinylbenzoic acid--CoA ligase
MARLAKALASDGPALSFGPTSLTHISEKISVVVSTTGSSGVSKSVGLSSSALLASARASNKFLHAEFGNSWSLLLPLTHIAGINILIRSLELGTEPVDLRNTDGEYPRADFTAIVPTQLFRALNGDEKLLTHLKAAQFVLVGGAKLHDDLLFQAINAGISILTTYGMSETSGGCIYEGTPLNGVQARISDTGLIEISGPILASGYLNNDELWNQHYRDGWFTTSDLGEINSDGTVDVLGRADDVFISGGEKVSLSSVSEKLEERYSQNNWCALALTDLKWGQRLVVAVAGVNPPSHEEVASLLGATFGNAAKPKQYLIFETFPLIGIGKIDRIALRKRAEDEFHG